MPQRTNDFQQLVREIQKALHGVTAKVEESAMVPNPVTGKRDEIDVLVTFSQGGMEYRVGFACRDRGRKGDQDWIHHLASQRDVLRLTRMVAVHSNGFTESTRILAEALRISLYHLRTQELSDVAVEFKMPNEVFAVSVHASADPCIDLVFAPSQMPVLTSDHAALEISIDGQPIDVPILHKGILEVCQQWIIDSLKLPVSTKLIAAQSVELEVQYTMKLSKAISVSMDRAAPITCIGLTGRALVNVHLRPVDNLQGFSYEDTGVITGNAEFPYGRMTMTYCKKGEQAWLAPIQSTGEEKHNQRPMVFMRGEMSSFRFREVGASPDGADILRAMLNPTNPSPSAAAARTPRSHS